MFIIQVKKGNIEQALKKLKSKTIKSKQQKILREKQDYTKPSVAKHENDMKLKKMKSWAKENKKM